MQDDTFAEARRQVGICNACRYCEGFCAVFPAINRKRAFADGDLTELANLCHNCRGCYYACQYTAPHEFDLNIPRVLAELRQESWERHVWPGAVARVFGRHGLAIAGALVLVIAAFVLTAGGPDSGAFYAVLPHEAMVAIFLPAFLAPLLVLALSLRSYWHAVGGEPVRMAHLVTGLAAALSLRNLSGGHGEGCNFEDEDRYTNARRRSHQAVLWGFLFCFGATVAGTVLHYGFASPAPYGLLSLPKLLGVPGGVLLCLGTAGLWVLKRRADTSLGDARALSGEYAFIALLFLVSASGLALYAATGTGLVPELLALHLGAVLTLFVLIPYSKMVHGAFRLAALVRDSQSAQITASSRIGLAFRMRS